MYFCVITHNLLALLLFPFLSQAEIVELQQRSIYVSSNQTCELCKRNILSTQVRRFAWRLTTAYMKEGVRPNVF